jgi:hypothetical protein
MVRESHRSLIKFYDKHYKNSMSPLLYSVITRAVLWNEKRILRKLGEKCDEADPGLS